jgi:hypothetical protein
MTSSLLRCTTLYYTILYWNNVSARNLIFQKYLLYMEEFPELLKINTQTDLELRYMAQVVNEFFHGRIVLTVETILTKTLLYQKRLI